jgi:hypothetical protein
MARRNLEQEYGKMRFLLRTLTCLSHVGRETILAAVAVVFAACSSNSPIASGLGGGGAGGGGAAGSAAPSGPCPSQVPTTGEPCSGDSLVCEFGDDPNPWCHTLAYCQVGNWRVYEPDPGTSVVQCPSTRASTCPATLEAARDVACSEMGAWCTWAPGTTCQCTNCGPSVGGAPFCDGNPTWHCARSTPTCPVAMPRSGTPCVTDPDNPWCPYGCKFGARRCTAGLWAAESDACPTSTRAAKEDIHYLSPAELEQLAAATQAMKVARYRYRSPAFGAPGPHLGFIIEDSPDVPAVSASKTTVDLYGFASMLLATSQAQSRRIEALERELGRLRAAERERAGAARRSKRAAP